MEKHAREFRGKTELDIEAQFSRWQQANAGLVFNVKRHPIERLPPPVQRPGFEHRPLKIADAFLMLVEYMKPKLMTATDPVSEPNELL